MTGIGTISPAHADLLQRIDTRTAVVGVIGLGHAGLPIAAAMLDAGFPVIGFDTDSHVVDRWTGRAPVTGGLVTGGEVSVDPAREGRWHTSSEFSMLSEVDAILLCVPTPLGEDDRPDLSHVEAAADAVAARLQPGQLVVLESTTWPGTTREVLLPRLERTGLCCGVEVFVAYSPARVDPGRAEPSPQQIPRLVGGVDAASCDAATRLYSAAHAQVVPVSSAEVAEAAKLLENVYRAVNIALVNEMKMVLGAMDIDVHEVIDAAATKPFGFQAFRPGPGWGGHCIPIDPFYLAWKADQVGSQARFVELAGRINRAMPDYVIGRLRDALSERGTELSAARVLVVGLAYKPDIADLRESPSLQLIGRVLAAGAHADYHDPHVPAMPACKAPELPAMGSVPLHEAELAKYDAVLIATDHSAVDYELIARVARLVVDTRGVMRGLNGEHIIQA
jgi:UDP-N-acetyl-D-glucosamine dehydrogenase